MLFFLLPEWSIRSRRQDNDEKPFSQNHFKVFQVFLHYDTSNIHFLWLFSYFSWWYYYSQTCHVNKKISDDSMGRLFLLLFLRHTVSSCDLLIKIIIVFFLMESSFLFWISSTTVFWLGFLCGYFFFFGLLINNTLDLNTRNYCNCNKLTYFMCISFINLRIYTCLVSCTFFLILNIYSYSFSFDQSFEEFRYFCV